MCMCVCVCVCVCMCVSLSHTRQQWCCLHFTSIASYVVALTVCDSDVSFFVSRNEQTARREERLRASDHLFRSTFFQHCFFSSLRVHRAYTGGSVFPLSNASQRFLCRRGCEGRCAAYIERPACAIGRNGRLVRPIDGSCASAASYDSGLHDVHRDKINRQASEMLRQSNPHALFQVRFQLRCAD